MQSLSILLLKLFCLFMTASTNAKANEQMWKVNDSIPRASESTIAPESQVKPQRAQTKNRESLSVGNLPQEYLLNRKKLEQITSNTVLPDSKLKQVLKQLEMGSELSVVIPHSVIAFSDEKAPVVSEVQEGRFKGARLIGSARLDINSKRIFIDFNLLSFRGMAYSFKGSGLTSSSQPGFEGEYHSHESTLFTGEFLSSMTAAYFDGLIPRTTNVFGQTQTDNSVDSAVKKGLSSGATATADRFRDKLKKNARVF